MNEPAPAAEGIPRRAFPDYRPASGAYDEFLDTGGAPRPRWAPLIERFATLLSERPADDSGPPRFDPLPYVFDVGEWRAVERGLLQRSRLLNALVADFHGPRQLLRRHGLPPALLFANPAYLPQCGGYPAPGGVFLHRLAFDLGRSPDGQWRVLANRTDAPAGLGQALENRFESDRLLPGAMDGAGVEPLAGFFDAFANRLKEPESAPEDGICVFLAGGPGQARHEDDAFLGRRLGIRVAEGHELRVGRNRAYLETPEGPEPVRVVARQTGSLSCDPLEFCGASHEGTPGLLACAARGRVRVENAIGSGVVESAALAGFLPGLCRSLLGEPLMLPDLATWWCGQAREAAHVAGNLNSLQVHRAFEGDSGGGGNLFAGLLPEPLAPDGASLRKEMALRPYDYLGREPIMLSTMPCRAGNGRLQPAPLSLRLFVASTGDGYRLMPGGLARVATARGTVCKDVWVPGSRATAPGGRR